VEPMDITLLLGAGFLAYLAIRQQQSNADFSSFMSGIGGDDVSSIVPVSDTDVSSGGSSSMLTIQDWANAMFNVEGGNAGNRNVRNNNPGNLKAAPDQFTGAVTQRDSDGFVIFPSMDAGWAALNNQLTKWLNESPSLTLTQFYAKYLGQADYLNPQVTAEGNPFTYAQTVADKLGVDPNQTIGSIFGGHS